MFIQSGPLGQIGIITDPPEHTLPVGAWSGGANMRFSDSYIERIKEPSLLPDTAPVPGHDPVWIEQWFDSNGPQVAYASETKLFKYNTGTDSWDDVSKALGLYTSGTWQSFPWGSSVVFNNGSNPPQILYEGASEFVDLPNWGLISSDPANPMQDVDTQATCAVIRPYGNFLVAINVRENATLDDFPNRVWWSGPATKFDSSAPADNPSWDYADLGSLSGISTIAAEDGPLLDQLQLGAANIIYTRQSFWLMLATGDQLNVFNFDRGQSYGIASIHAVAEFNNVHIAMTADTVYLHDGSTVTQLSDGRIQRGLFARNPVLSSIQAEHYLAEREVHILFESTETDINGNAKRFIFVYNYKDNTFTFLDGFTGTSTNQKTVKVLNYGTRSTQTLIWDDATGSWDSQAGSTWIDFAGTPDKRRLFWVNEDGFYLTEDSEALNTDKTYFVERGHIDLSELAPAMTADRWKELRQIYPHIDTNTSGGGVCDITAGWSETLQSPAASLETVSYDPSADTKVDFRTTGRYLFLRVEVKSGNTFRFTSMDYDVDVTYGR